MLGFSFGAFYNSFDCTGRLSQIAHLYELITLKQLLAKSTISKRIKENRQSRAIAVRPALNNKMWQATVLLYDILLQSPVRASFNTQSRILYNSFQNTYASLTLSICIFFNFIYCDNSMSWQKAVFHIVLHSTDVAVWLGEWRNLFTGEKLHWS